MLSKHLLMLGAVGALICAGCSEPVPPAAEGAAVILWGGSAAGCAIHAVHEGRIGKADANEIVDIKKDTIAGAEVTCRVTGSGTFSAEGGMKLGAVTIDFKVDSAPLSATKDTPALGHVIYSDVITAGAVYTSPETEPCRFWFSPAQQPQIAAGRFWVQFGCTSVVDAGTASTCAIQDESTLAVQNCEQ
jgi:hypothetical protein